MYKNEHAFLNNDEASIIASYIKAIAFLDVDLGIFTIYLMNKLRNSISFPFSLFSVINICKCVDHQSQHIFKSMG